MELADLIKMWADGIINKTITPEDIPPGRMRDLVQIELLRRPPTRK